MPSLMVLVGWCSDKSQHGENDNVESEAERGWCCKNDVNENLIEGDLVINQDSVSCIHTYHTCFFDDVRNLEKPEIYAFLSISFESIITFWNF